LIIQNVTNLSLIGTGRTKYSVAPVIKCLSNHHIRFYNVVNLLLQNLTFDKCGNSVGLFTQGLQNRDYYWANLFFNSCIHVRLVDVVIIDPFGYAIAGHNVIGNSSLENVNVTITENLHLSFVCSLAIHWSYDGHMINESDTNVYFDINKFKLTSHDGPHICSVNKSMIYFFVYRFHALNFVTISYALFDHVKTYNSAIHIDVDSSSQFRANFYKCNATFNTLSHFLDFYYSDNSTKLYPRAMVTFIDTLFQSNAYALTNKSSSIMQFTASSKLLRFELYITLKNINFTSNELALLRVVSHSPQLKYNHYFVNISFEGNCTVQYNEYSDSLMELTDVEIQFKGNIMFKRNAASQILSLENAQMRFNGITEIFETHAHELISLANGRIDFTGITDVSYNDNYQILLLLDAQVHFNGSTIFTNNDAIEIIQSWSSLLHFSNNILFEHNYVIQIVTLYPKLSYLLLLGNANLTFSNNIVCNEMIEIVTIYNHPYPYCLFQYYLPENNKPEDFQIDLLFDDKHSPDVDLLKEIDSINKLTSQCNWSNDSAFQNYNPFAVNSQVINIRLINKTLSHQLSLHSTVCYCPQVLKYDCNFDELGPIYPGQNLTVDLCLPYNVEDVGILYADAHSNYMPTSICKISDSETIKHVFYRNQTKSVNFTIAVNFNQPIRECQLLLSAQPNLFTYYDAFKVYLLPCPLGFTLNKGICGCDPLLNKYISNCKICYQTVKRLSNVYISGIKTESSRHDHEYSVSTSCPADYCLKSSRIDLRYPNTQCQPHRTGQLCSVCKKNYSMVFGSRKCRKCSTLHLLFIILIILNGLFLVFFLFFLNFTVTTGTINGIIFYVNIVFTNNTYFNLPDRLITPFSAYLSITNLSLCFEMCFYNGMDMYAKKWLQLTYPLYLMIIMLFFIIGSRYSRKLYRLTFNRALPVLATLFMLTYTSMLQIIATMFFYVKIITVPHNTVTFVWGFDATIPLFGWKYLLLFIVCIVLFLFLLTLNVVLLFTKYLMKFNIIARFKPLIDAFQGSLKSEYSYWIGIQLLVRSIMIVLLVPGRQISISLSCIMILSMAIVHSRIQPDNNKLNNLQELLLLYNYVVMCVLLILNRSEILNVITVNVLIGLSFIQFFVITIYHALTFISPCKKLMNKITNAWNNIVRNHHLAQDERHPVIEIPEVSFADFREPLIGEDW